MSSVVMRSRATHGLESRAHGRRARGRAKRWMCRGFDEPEHQMCSDYLDAIDFGESVEQGFITLGIGNDSSKQVVCIPGDPPVAPDIGPLRKQSFKYLRLDVACVYPYFDEGGDA